MKKEKQVTKKTFGKRAAAMALVAALGVVPCASSALAYENPSDSSAAVTAALSNKDVIDSSAKGSITIYKYDYSWAESDAKYSYSAASAGTGEVEDMSALADYVIAGVEFSYVKVGEVEQMTNADGAVQTVYEISLALVNALGLDTADAISTTCTNSGKYHYTSDQINTAAAKASTDVSLRTALETYLSSAGATAFDLTDSYGYTKAENLSVGLYLLAETAVPDVVIETIAPFFVSIPMTASSGESWFYDVTVYPKNKTGSTSMDLKVKSNETSATYGTNATATTGESISWMTQTALPTISGSSTYLNSYSLAVTMDSSVFTISSDMYVYLYDNESDASGNNTDNAVETWSVSDDALSAGTLGNVTTLALTNTGLSEINTNYAEGYYLVFAGSATVTTTGKAVLGDEGNPINVALSYTRTSSGSTTTLEDQSYIYSYGVDLTKAFSDGNGTATKAAFTLYNNTDSYYLTATGSNGSYVVSGSTTDASAATEFVPSASGSLVVEGLEADTYVLTETKTADGYALLSEKVTISISSTNVNVAAASISNQTKTEMNINKLGITNATASVNSQTVAMTSDTTNSSANAFVPLTVTSTKTLVNMPITGETPVVYAVVLAGGAIVAAGLFARRRRSAKAA